MARWEVEVIFEPTGDYMNFEYETDNEDEDSIFNEISNDDVYVCPNCDEEWEDEAAALHYDKFEDLEKCAGCATIEEIKEIEEMETHDANLRG